MPVFRLSPVLAFCIVAVSAGTAPAANPPAWGDIDEPRAGLGRYRFRVERPPADGRIAVPTGFPQIVRARVADGPAEQDVPVELNADATSVVLVLPSTAGTPCTVAVETADGTRQFDDGRIVFTALDARLHGDQVRLESHPGNARIGFWTNPEDSVSWKRQATRWGTYDVRLTYSSASPPGSEIAVDVCGTTLSGTLAGTGSWYRYTTLSLGRVSLPTAGEQTVTVRCTKQVGAAVMNLKALVLEPACEGAPPVQADDGTVTLHGRDATVRGTVLRYEPAEKKRTLGFWTRGTDAACWTFTVRRSGEFDVEVLQGCGNGQGGSEMLVEVDAGTPHRAAIAFTVEETGGFQEFRPRIVGRVRVSEAGDHHLQVTPVKIAKAAACDIRQIRLVPAVSP